MSVKELFKNRSRRVAAASALVLAAVLPQLYMNCGQLAAFHASSSSSISDPSKSETNVDHPPEKPVSPPSQAVMMGHRKYVASVLREVFAGPTSSPGYLGALDAHTRYWVDNKGGQFGLPCNQYETTTGQNCDGSISNVNGPMRVDDNLVRESFRIRVCEEILSNYEAVTAGLSKIERTSEAPTLDSIRQATELFYRGEPPSEIFVQTLLNLDRDLAAKRESVGERWRMMFIMICESPDWQLI